MLIPKKIYQTWKTKNLSEKLQNVRTRISQMNPDYEMILFDDNDIDVWIKENFEEESNIYNVYKKLKVGAARADFWRYLILYKNGGVYLDIDSDICKPLSKLIRENDSAIISREKYSGTTFFIQWALFFAPQHPILLYTINLCMYNILNKTSDWLPSLTGPGVFTIAVNHVLKKKFNFEKSKVANLFFYQDDGLNKIFNNVRFFGYDYNSYLKYDNGCKDDLLRDSTHWKNDKKIFAS